MSTSPVAGPTRTSVRSWSVLLGVLLAGLVADLWSKSAAFERVADVPVEVRREQVMRTEQLGRLIPPHEPVIVVPNILEFTLVLNPGAVFGLGAGKRLLFIGFTLVAVVMGLWMFLTWTTRRDWLAHASLGLLLSGGLGNLYDRVKFACVRDFIHPLPGVRIAGREIWPYVSNVADAFLIVGIIGLMWHLWRSDSGPPSAEAAEPGRDQPNDGAVAEAG
ncbi:MAG: signal peptidase II [Planctomycetota bacterium]